MAAIGAFKWGSKDLPIIGHVTINNSDPDGRPDLSSVLSASDAWLSGTSLGRQSNGLPPDGSISTNSSLKYGGVTDFHDNVDLIVGNDQEDPPDSPMSSHLNYVRTRVDTTTIDDNNMVTCSGYSGYTSYDDTTICRAAVYSFDYPDASDDRYKVNGYCVVYSYRETRKREDGTVYTDEYRYGTYQIDLPYINLVYNKSSYYDELPIPDPEEPYEPSEPQPINPTIDDSSDIIGIPTDPTIGVTSAGFINVYHPGINALYNLGDIIFPNVATATDVVTALIKLCETMANGNLINYVIDCHIMPVAPVDGTNAEIKVGFRNTGITVPRVASDYVNVSCGSLSIPEYFGNFADYLTKVKLYLPFVGYVDIKPEFIQSGTLFVDYKFNVIDGSFMAYVRATSSKSQLSASMIGCYSGNACMHLPLTGNNYSNMVSGIIGAAVAASSGGTTSAALGSAYSAANALAKGGEVQQSNGYNSTAAILGVRTPYLQIERPVQSWPSTFAHTKGLPSNIGTQLSNVHGFTTIDNIDLSGLPFTEGEINELRSLLTEGVYF